MTPGITSPSNSARTRKATRHSPPQNALDFDPPIRNTGAYCLAQRDRNVFVYRFEVPLDLVLRLRIVKYWNSNEPGNEPTSDPRCSTP